MYEVFLWVYRKYSSVISMLLGVQLPRFDTVALV